jgi:phosphatidylinositol alpha-mannosyltransferase
VHVALVHPYSWPAVRRGGERYAHDLARWLVQRGHQVDLLTGAGAEHASATVIPLPVREPARLQPHGVTALDTFGLSALQHLSRHRYDVVHSLIPSGALAAAVSFHPSVYTLLGHPSPDNLPPRRWTRALLTQAVRTARVAAALSSSAAEGAEGVTGRRPIVLPPGVRTQDFVPREQPLEGPPRLLFNAFASDPRKGLVTLLRALPSVLEQLPETRLALGGGGDPSPALDQLDPGLRREVSAVLDDLGTGSLHDVPARYQAATVSVLPSVHEAFGLVLVESLACGVPVVCSRSGGMPEIVTEAVGRTAAPEDSEDLARAIVSAVELAQQPGAARACVERAACWDWDVVGPMHELAYARARG